MRKVILLLVMCCSLTGCAGGGLYNVAAASYERKSGYHDKGLEEASNGWVLVSDTVGNLGLSAPRGGISKEARVAPLTVDHRLKIWWQPAKKLLFAVNYYTRSGTRLFLGSASGASHEAKYSFNQVGQSISVLDLEAFIGFNQYNVYHNTQVRKDMVIPDYHVEFPPDYFGQYRNFDQFYSNNDIKTYMFREPSSRGQDLNLRKTLEGQSEWFSFDRSLWSPFLKAAEVNGKDKAKWAAWDARKFFLKDLQIHLPGVYVASDKPATKVMFQNAQNPAFREPITTSVGQSTWDLKFSEDEGRFIKSTEAISAEVKAKLDSMLGAEHLNFQNGINKGIDRGLDSMSAMLHALMNGKREDLGKSVAGLLLLRAMGGQKSAASNEKSDGEGAVLGQGKTSEKVGEEIPDAAIQQMQAELARKLAEITGIAAPVQAHGSVAGREDAERLAIRNNGSKINPNIGRKIPSPVMPHADRGQSSPVEHTLNRLAPARDQRTESETVVIMAPVNDSARGGVLQETEFRAYQEQVTETIKSFMPKGSGGGQ